MQAKYGEELTFLETEFVKLEAELAPQVDDAGTVRRRRRKEESLLAGVEIMCGVYRTQLSSCLTLKFVVAGSRDCI